MKDLKTTANRLKELGQTLKILSYHITKNALNKIYTEYSNTLKELNIRYPDNEVINRQLLHSAVQGHIERKRYGDAKLALQQDLSELLHSLEEYAY